MSKLLSTIVTIYTPVKFNTIFSTVPKRFTEVVGKQSLNKPAAVRFVNGKWIGQVTGGIKVVIAKKYRQTVILKDSSVTIMGPGNSYKSMLPVLYRSNKWCPRSILKSEVFYSKINGSFKLPKPVNLVELEKSLLSLPTNKSVQYLREIFPAVILKLKEPGITYQIFANGRVLFTGIHKIEDLDKPREFFMTFFDPDLLQTNYIGNNYKNTSGKTLANRYALAKNFNVKPPPGFYIRPGTNGKPRYYLYRHMHTDPATRERVNTGPMNLRAVAPKVVKAFKAIGRPIPKHTVDVFANAGINLVNKAAEEPSKTERRAPSWNATKNGFYVRPGPGQQPYWAAVPKILASGRKTVIKKYTDAGRNIPKAVREIFKIPNNVKINTNPKHNITVGLDGHLRINGKQAHRFTIAQLVAIARNLNIAAVSNKMTPALIIDYIRLKSGLRGKIAKKNFNIEVNGVKYKFLNNGHVEKTKGKIRTTREWATLPNRNKIAQAYLNENNYNAYKTSSNKYKMILNQKEFMKNLFK
jgi:hypothetical protein